MTRVAHGEDVAREHGARPADPGELVPLQAMVRELAHRADVPPPPLWIQETPTPNAFAMGFTPYDSVVAVTTGLVDLLTPAEISAVLAHEIGHVRHEHVAETTALITKVAQQQGLLRNVHIASAALTLVTGMAGDLIWAATTVARLAGDSSAKRKVRDFSYRKEFEADGHARAMGLGPWLRSALRKVDADGTANTLPPWASLAWTFDRGDTHPPTPTRVDALDPGITDWFQQAECSACLAVSPPGSTSCSRCGHHLAGHPCATCSAPSRAGHHWCVHCGTAIDPVCGSCGQGDQGGPFCTGCGGQMPSRVTTRGTA